MEVGVHVRDIWISITEIDAFLNWAFALNIDLISCRSIVKPTRAEPVQETCKMNLNCVNVNNRTST